METTVLDLLNLSCDQKSSVLAKGEMPFSNVVEEGPSDVLDCNEIRTCSKP